ncbi:MAG: helix-turn-helix transcriptional regulator [bacterium]|nr:helix-turn-helix transcriptional regulator [bacterium]
MKKLSAFSINLKRIRKEKGLSQYDLADMTGISQRMITHYETKVSEPSLAKVEILAEKLNVKISDLLDPDDKNDVNIDVSQFDTRSLKKLQDILSLPNNDRADLYRMLNRMLKKNQLEKQQKDKINK